LRPIRKTVQLLIAGPSGPDLAQSDLFPPAVSHYRFYRGWTGAPAVEDFEAVSRFVSWLARQAAVIHLLVLRGPLLISAGTGFSRFSGSAGFR